MDRLNIDNSWSLFLDRDGVINEEIHGSYVTNWTEFKFCDGALDALKTANELFGHIIVVTNQRGVGKGIMTLETLKEIHINMVNDIVSVRGRVDKVYACTATDDNDHNRKPNTGMGIQAKEDFPAIDFRRSIMVGNSMSDMEFGKKLGMHTVLLTTKLAPVALPHDLIDEQYPTLDAWAKTLVPEMAH